MGQEGAGQRKKTGSQPTASTRTAHTKAAHMAARFTGSLAGCGTGAVRLGFRGATPVFFGAAAVYGSGRCKATQENRALTHSFYIYYIGSAGT